METETAEAQTFDYSDWRAMHDIHKKLYEMSEQCHKAGDRRGDELYTHAMFAVSLAADACSLIAGR